MLSVLIFSQLNNQRVKVRPNSTNSAAWSTSVCTMLGTVHSIKYKLFFKDWLLHLEALHDHKKI
ncbi:asl8018 (plasmid) [Nostoc sp. PCC 7120 = FACHB-418]|nr:asl8018 [Nostoc sp. PCC 7120 = FACHB-418]